MNLELDTEEAQRERVCEGGPPIAAPEAHVSCWVKPAEVRADRFDFGLTSVHPMFRCNPGQD